MRVLILLTAHAGLRIEEALTLTWPDVDTRHRRLTVRGKGNKMRIIGLSGTLLDALQDHAGRGKGGRLFTFRYRSGAAYHLRRLMEAEGLRWTSFHPYRKYNGTLLYKRTRDFARVAHHLGHASVNTTRAYVEVPADDLADLSPTTGPPFLFPSPDLLHPVSRASPCLPGRSSITAPDARRCPPPGLQQTLPEPLEDQVAPKRRGRRTGLDVRPHGTRPCQAGLAGSASQAGLARESVRP